MGFAGPAPSDFPSDLPSPEPLSGAQLKDADVLVNILGEYVVAALFSKVWQLREAALHHINLALSEQVGLLLQRHVKALLSLERGLGPFGPLVS